MENHSKFDEERARKYLQRHAVEYVENAAPATIFHGSPFYRGKDLIEAFKAGYEHRAKQEDLFVEKTKVLIRMGHKKG
jgi:hypothetical protein